MSDFIKKPEDIKQLIEARGGCLASNKITMDGEPIGYAYREEPDDGFTNDSGWRFLSGTEDDGYTDNPENFNVFQLNTICNYDARIIPFLSEPIGTTLADDHGKLVKIAEQT